MSYSKHTGVTMLLVLLVLSLCACPGFTALPQFSWDTMPVFFHSSNTSGQYNDQALKTIAKFQMATIEKVMGYDVQGTDDEDEMVLAMIAIKKVNPKISTYFYMNSFKDRPEMTRVAREMEQHPNYFLMDDDGNWVKNKQGYYAFDLSKQEVQKWWRDICLNATSFAKGDGCFCDSSQRENSTFTPSPSEEKLKAWGGRHAEPDTRRSRSFRR